MADFEVHLSLNAETRRIGLMRVNEARGKELLLFEYDATWLDEAEGFALEPGLPLTRGSFAPSAGRVVHGAIGDSAPDTWGIKEVATATAEWRQTAKALGLRSAEIERMSSAFEHDDLRGALAL